jgi:pyruvate/2-oxoglutarate dehydrogenase complex dihydrolipoamide dehydrogenase (E3) component
MKNITTDICIIGAGSGGLSVAAGAAQLGMNVTLIEKSDMGGDCLNTGCVPSKALLAMGKKQASFAEAHKHVKRVIAQIEPHDSQERFEGLGCNVIRAHAKIIDKNHVETADGYKIKTKFIVITTGSTAFVPQIKGLEHDKILTNENIFDLTKKPSHLIVIGGGPIGVEMAQAHANLGCKVTLIDMASIMPKDDSELVDIVRQSLVKQGIIIMEDTAIKSITHGDKSHTVHTDNGDIDGSHILVATGRRSNVNGLGLADAGIEFNGQGISVNARLQTNYKNVFAIGDVNGGPQFTHIAGYQAGIIIRNICFRMPAKVDYKALPWVTYTSPELAHVGMTLTDAKAKYGDDKIRIITQEIAKNDRAIAEGGQGGLIKVIGRTNGQILGVSIVTNGAGDMLPLWSLAIQKNMKMSDIAGLILPYPTIMESHKGIAGAWYKDQLFSEKTRKIIKWLQRLPIF